MYIVIFLNEMSGGVLCPHLSGIALPLCRRSVEHLGLKCVFRMSRVMQEIGEICGD